MVIVFLEVRIEIYKYVFFIKNIKSLFYFLFFLKKLFEGYC